MVFYLILLVTNHYNNWIAKKKTASKQLKSRFLYSDDQWNSGWKAVPRFHENRSRNQTIYFSFRKNIRVVVSSFFCAFKKSRWFFVFLYLWYNALILNLDFIRTRTLATAKTPISLSLSRNWDTGVNSRFTKG
jgi:hypothetical protein